MEAGIGFIKIGSWMPSFFCLRFDKKGPKSKIQPFCRTFLSHEKWKKKKNFSLIA
jgi:hypothetical protein